VRPWVYPQHRKEIWMLLWTQRSDFSTWSAKLEID
jgi:hypothetical protein